jgi:hypothetical protein
MRLTRNSTTTDMRLRVWRDIHGSASDFSFSVWSDIFGCIVLLAFFLGEVSRSLDIAK